MAVRRSIPSSYHGRLLHDIYFDTRKCRHVFFRDENASSAAVISYARNTFSRVRFRLLLIDRARVRRNSRATVECYFETGSVRGITIVCARACATEKKQLICTTTESKEKKKSGGFNAYTSPRACLSNFRSRRWPLTRHGVYTCIPYTYAPSSSLF